MGIGWRTVLGVIVLVTAIGMAGYGQVGLSDCYSVGESPAYPGQPGCGEMNSFRIGGLVLVIMGGWLVAEDPKNDLRWPV